MVASGENARRAWRVAARSRAPTHRAPHGPPPLVSRADPQGTGRTAGSTINQRMIHRRSSIEALMNQWLAVKTAAGVDSTDGSHRLAGVVLPEVLRRSAAAG